MSEKFLPYGRQLIEDDDIAAVVAVLKGDWLTTGPTVDRFETALAARVGARFAVACSSGTAALHLAALALGLGPGDRAIVPSMTFLATANAVRYAGADVAFSDVDAETGLMGPEHFETALAESAGRARAVLPVHLAGQTADLPALAKAAAPHGVAIIEDACHALGTTYRDGAETVAVGSCRHSAMTVFSFHPVKTVATGEGGAVTTNDPALYEKMKRLRSHGTTQASAEFRNAELAFGAGGEANPWYYESHELGFNYRASDIHCALALSQLGKLGRFASKRRALAELYDRKLAALAPVILPPSRAPGCDPAWHLYAARFDFQRMGMPRETLMRRLMAAGIGTQVHYIPVPWQPYYSGRDGAQNPGGQFPGAAAYYRQTLSLPLFPAMEEADVARVVAALAACVEAGGKLR